MKLWTARKLALSMMLIVNVTPCDAQNQPDPAEGRIIHPEDYGSNPAANSVPWRRMKNPVNKDSKDDDSNPVVTKEYQDWLDSVDETEEDQKSKG